MKSAVETLNPTRVKLTVQVPFEELKPSLDAAYKKIAQQINIPGFRKGKVPPMVIDRQVGRGAVLDEAVNEVVPQKYFAALEENSLTPLAQPEIEVTKLEDNDTLEFTAEVDVKPSFDLPDYEGVEAEVTDTFEVSDALKAVVRRLVPTFADLCFADLIDEARRVVRIEVAVGDPRKTHLSEALKRPPLPVMDLGEPVLLAEAAPGALALAVASTAQSGFAVTVAGAGVVLGLTLLCFLLASFFTRFLHETLLRGSARVIGVLLMAIAMNFIVSGWRGVD